MLTRWQRIGRVCFWAGAACVFFSFCPEGNADEPNAPQPSAAIVEQGESTPVASVVQNAEEADTNPLNLALKNISLTQGENGFELWRLKAEWANVIKENDLIIMEEPRLTYFMKDGGKVLFVQSKRGEIEQKKQIITFIDEVKLTQDDKILTGDKLIYDGPQKTMTIPGLGYVKTSSMSGEATDMVWLIEEQKILVNTGVSIDMEAKATVAPEKSDSTGSEQTPENEKM